jgi:hypothetical protein
MNLSRVGWQTAKLPSPSDNAEVFTPVPLPSIKEI